ncbi:MAG: hypothetical protein D5S00_08690 [Tindallia sp. MSAO_Bac2]|nr:MAG: hypothetical protein D5S00_08690 [Tindallia sp. MSAO_Bac2]
MKNNSVMAVSIALIIITFFSSLSAYAHAMFIEAVEEGKVQVIFDDGTPNRHAEVIVYDEADKEIERGNVDRQGYFSYAAKDAVRLVAKDNFGHRAEYVIGEETRKQLPRIPTVAGVLAIFILIAAFFQHRTNKRKAAEV